MGRQFFFVASITAMANLAALAGVAGLACSRGYLERDRVQAAAAALRGELSLSQPATLVVTSAPAEVVPSAEQIARNEAADAIRRAELERRERETEHAWQQLEMRQLAILKQKEEFEAARKRNANELEARASAVGDSGWDKQVDLIGQAKPKTAKELLLKMSDPEVAKVFMQLESRKVGKIIEQCKTAEERSWIGRILDQLHNRDAARAETTGAVNAPIPGA